MATASSTSTGLASTARWRRASASFAYLWLQHAGAGPEKERRYRVHTIEANPDPTYGGFRRALAAYYGCSSSLPALLREVKATRRLPDAGPLARARTPRRY